MRPILLAGSLLGLFLARFWYELDPGGFSVFGDWPGAIALAIAGAIFLWGQWRLALRRLLPPEAVLPVHLPFILLALYIFWPEVDLRLAAIVLLATAGLSIAIGLRAIASSLKRDLRPLIPAALALLVFGLYLRTLGGYVGKADTFEFQVVAPTLGVAHPTGYPLYVLIGKLFSLLPIGSMAFRVNLTSAVFATAATLAVYALIVRLGGRRAMAFVAALSFAVSSVVWSQAVVAEVYALNAFIAATVLWLLVRLIGSASGDAACKSNIVQGLFLALGLGLSHHLTTVLLLPAVALSIVIARPRLPVRATLTALGLFLLGLAMWLYIPLRWPALNGGVSMTWGEFIDWITGARFGGALVLNAWSDPARWEIVTRLLSEAFGPIGLGLAAAGLIGLALRYRRAAAITLIAFAAYVFYGLVYFVPDISVFLIPAHLIAAIWIGLGATFIFDAAAKRIARADSSLVYGRHPAWRAPAASRRTGRERSGGRSSTSSSTRFARSESAQTAPAAYSLALTALALLPVMLIGGNFARVDQRAAGRQIEAWGRYVLGLPILPGAAILVDSEKIAPLYYLQVTENLRPDLSILVLGTEQEYRQQLDARLAQGQPVYLARFLPNLPYPMRSLGPLVEVGGDSGGAAQALSPIAAAPKFGDLFDLAGLSYEVGNPARVTFGWRALTASRSNYYVRLQLVDANGRAWWEDRGAHPVGGFYPTGAWPEGEIVTDFHEIELDPALPPGAYQLMVGLFPPFRDDGLPTETGAAWWPAAQIDVPATPAPPLERALRQTFGGQVALVGIAPPGVTPQSSDGQLRVNWARTREAGDSALRVLLSLVDATGRVVSTSDFEPDSGVVRVKDWPAGVRQSLLSFHTPAQDGVYDLRFGFVDATGRPLAARCGWLAPESTACTIGSVQVAGEAIGDAINFDNQVLLTDWSLDRTEMRPGETIQARLDWRGLHAWGADYTVTVQLIGPDGSLHGQVDAGPVQGTLPTSTWRADQVVQDAYAVTLQPGSPPGRYQVIVAWYLLATSRRLPVLDAQGRPLDDRAVLGEVDVP